MTTRYDQLGPLDDAPTTLGDRGFIGVNSRLDPAQLPPAYVSEAINCRFRYGVAEPRKGFFYPPWANNTTTGTRALTITRTFPTAMATSSGNHGLKHNSVVVISGATPSAYNGTFIVTVTGLNTFTYTLATDPGASATGSPVMLTYDIQPWGEVHGIGVFSDPYTLQEYLVIAANGTVYYTQPGNRPQPMVLPAGVVISGRVEFTQAFDILLMHRGASEPTLMLPRITSPWQLVEQTVTGDGSETIPNGTHSIFLQNRLFIPNDKDEIAVSDLNDYTRYLPVLQEFKVNQGSADELVAIHKFNDTTIIAFKEQSIYALGNVYGNLSALQMDELTNQFGLAARRSVAHVGKDLWFLSELGVMTITQTEQNKLQGVVLPASDPIQPIIERINWKYAANAVAQVWDSKYYLALPLDSAEVIGPELSPVTALHNGPNVMIATTAGHTYRYTKGSNDLRLENGTQIITTDMDFVAQGSTVLLNVTIFTRPGSVMEVWKGVNNACLVYDFLNQAWSGYDVADGFAWRELFRCTVNAVRRLFVITNLGWIALAEEDFEDSVPVPYVDVELTLAPEGGESFVVNGGTLVSFDAAGNVNTGTTLGMQGLALTAIQDLMWSDFDAFGGYSIGTDAPWSAPNTTKVPIPQGVRFYGTNGAIPNFWNDFALLWTVTEVNTVPINMQLTTRGYASAQLSMEDYQWLVADIQTWAPHASLEMLTTGVNEVAGVLTDWTRDRTKYYEPADQPDYDLDNDNGDFLTPKRQDYSLLLGSAIGIGAAPDFALHTTPDGVPLDRHQEVRVTEHIVVSGRAAQLRVTSEDGRVRLMATALETKEDQLTAGVQA